MADIIIPDEYRNRIFSWHGGGYDGCIWEPNLAYTDPNGKYHPVISTGCDGINDAETLLSVIAERDERERDGSYFSRGPFNVLEMNQKGVDFLCRTVRNDYVAHLVDRLNEDVEIPGTGFEMVCTHCGRHFSSVEYSFSDLSSIIASAGYYHGDGGIGTITDDMFCNECRYDLVERIREDDWICVFGHAKRSLGLSRDSYCVKRVTEDGDFVVEDNGREVVVDSDDCEKTY